MSEPLSEPLRELIYVSAARRPFLPAELTELLRKARARNAAKGISGMLLYANGAFLQVLEGPESVVAEAYDRIELDTRHHRVLRLFSSVVEQRTFGDWSMGFVDGQDAAVSTLPGFTDFLKSGTVETLGAKESERIQSLSQQFRQGRWRQGIVTAVR